MTPVRRLLHTAPLVLALGFVAFASPSAAQEEEAPAAGTATWEEIVDGFFGRLEAGETVAALDFVYGTNPQLETQYEEQVAQAREQLAVLPELVGEYLGTERLAVQPIGERFVYVWQAGYFEHQPLQFHFSLYRPQDRWIVTTFSYDQQLNDTARQMARQQLVEE